ncbi:MAG: hypothetical protein M3P06_14535 [Acidobacteriota bacterium]|nr:hypothetical protein [Acidobacteriota bacterium]
MTVFDLLSSPDLLLQARSAPATVPALAELDAQAPMRLPPGYLELLRAANGLEGELGISPGWIQLWRAEDVLAMNNDYEVEQWHPGFFGFGSSGGGVMFAFSTAAGVDSPVFGMPFDSASSEDVVIITSRFAAFAQAIGREWQEAG